MIVNYEETGWCIIAQRAHGLLAGEICFNWKIQTRTKNWLETVVATMEHDDAFNEFETDEILLNEQGGPINFKMRDFEEDKCEKMLRLATSKSRFIALLMSQHLQFLYGQSENKKARKFCAALKKTDRQWAKEASVSAREISDAYAILQWCDALSLLICQKLIQPENRKIEISKGPSGIDYQLHTIRENVLTVVPWPFETDQFEVHYESRNVAQLHFKSEQEFRKVLMATPPVMNKIQMSRS